MHERGGRTLNRVLLFMNNRWSITRTWHAAVGEQTGSKTGVRCKRTDTCEFLLLPWDGYQIISL